MELSLMLKLFPGTVMVTGSVSGSGLQSGLLVVIVSSTKSQSPLRSNAGVLKMVNTHVFAVPTALHELTK